MLQLQREPSPDGSDDGVKMSRNNHGALSGEASAPRVDGEVSLKWILGGRKDREKARYEDT